MNDEIDPRNKLLSELDALLNQLKELTDKGLFDESKITPELADVMAQFDTMAKDFQALSDLVVADSGVSRDELLQRLAGTSDEMPPEAKRIVARGNHLKQKAQKAMESLNAPVDASLSDQLSSSLPSKSDFEKVQEKKTDKSSKKRSRKFKSLGDDTKRRPI